MVRMSTTDLPETLPIFPLTGALLLPHAQLPLNIFEPRYLEMIDDALREHRMIGMVQTHNAEDGCSKLYDVGCAGRIVSFDETEDGRYLITLLGLSRFRIKEEVKSKSLYRRIAAEWTEFGTDLQATCCFGFKKDDFFEILKEYFQRQDIEMNWDILYEAPDEKIISALSMICPFEPSEKQALLEAPCCKTRGEVLKAMLEIEIHKKII